MKYSVLWEDREDERSGQSFEVEAENSDEAFYKAIAELKDILKNSIMDPQVMLIDIECLVDENGNQYLGGAIGKETRGRIRRDLGV